jgi:hypothetical protein
MEGASGVYLLLIWWMRTNETDPVTSDESDRKRPNMSNMGELSKSIAGGH